jgi:hypothetical protein
MSPLPQSALVFGDGLEAAAICALLDLWIAHSFRYRLDALEKDTAHLILPSENSLVVFLSAKQGEDSLSYLAQQLTLLRFQVQWRGMILLIADAATIAQLQQWELFKLQQGAPYVAQTCLTRPVLVVELLSALATLRPYASGAWRLVNDTLKNQDSIQEAWKLFGQIQSEPLRDIEQVALLKTLLRILLDENLVLQHLLGHDGLRTVRHLADDLNRAYESSQETISTQTWNAIISTLGRTMQPLPKWESADHE